MMKSGGVTRKIFFALGTVNTLTVGELRDSGEPACSVSQLSVTTGNDSAYSVSLISKDSGSMSLSKCSYDGADAGFAVLEKAKSRVLEIHKKLSVFDEKSEIARINRYAGEKPVKVSEDTFALIERAKRYCEVTGGLFDITLSPVTRLWKRALKKRRTPEVGEVNAALVLAGYGDIITDHANMTVMLRRRGQQIELGSVAKGYAADEVRRIFREGGVSEGLIDLGGTVVNLGKVKRVGVQDPFAGRGRTFAALDAGEEAVVTSGFYEQFFEQDGRIYHHIVDPRTGHPSESGIAGVTLVGKSAEVLDALSTAAFVAGMEDAVGMIKKFGVEGVFVMKDRKVFVTEGLGKRLSFKENRPLSHRRTVVIPDLSKLRFHTDS